METNALAKRELYRSENGDIWHLARDENGRVFVLHRPNRESGGRLSRIEIGAFLHEGRAAPEHQALLRLIGSLVEDDSPR